MISFRCSTAISIPAGDFDSVFDCDSFPIPRRFLFPAALVALRRRLVAACSFLLFLLLSSPSFPPGDSFPPVISIVRSSAGDSDRLAGHPDRCPSRGGSGLGVPRVPPPESAPPYGPVTWEGPGGCGPRLTIPRHNLARAPFPRVAGVIVAAPGSRAAGACADKPCGSPGA